MARDIDASDTAAGHIHASAERRTVKVWDVWVRLFHWLLVALLVLAWYSGEYGFDELGAKTWHMRIGVAVLGLVVFRVLWGIVGSETARFSHFVRGPRAVIAHVRAMRRGEPLPIGHNPLGGWATVALLLIVLAQPVTGLFASDDILASGYLADDVPGAVQDAIGGWHKDLFNVLLALAGVHVAAVLAYVAGKRGNLIRWMVVGRRPVPASWPRPGFATPWRALACAAVAAGVAVGIPVIWG
jgi:cytochrome b